MEVLKFEVRLEIRSGHGREWLELIAGDEEEKKYNVLLGLGDALTTTQRMVH